jgi:5'-nucleotidase
MNKSYHTRRKISLDESRGLPSTKKRGKGMSLTGVVGSMAAFCTTVAFVPQIVKLRKQGGRDLAYSMLFLYLAGVLLWLVYGIRIHAVAVIWANSVASILVLISIVMKTNPRARKPTTDARRLRIAVDMDEVIADSFSEHLRRFNQEWGTQLTPAMVHEKGLKTAVPAELLEKFSAVPHGDGFFDELQLVPGSREALLELSRDHDIFIASAAMEVPSSFAAKFLWMEKHFPFIPPSRIVFCGDKNIINADILIDDRSRHFQGFRGTGILFTAPHNVAETGHLRANNWNEVVQILQDGRHKTVDTQAVARTLSMSPAR